MKVFYHCDADGHCAGYLVRDYFEKKQYYKKIDFVSIDYNQEFPLSSIEKNEEIWIVDFSLNPETMKKLQKITSEIVWIDHHKSAIDLYDNFDGYISGIRNVNYSGCELTCLYIRTMSGLLNSAELSSYLQLLKSGEKVPHEFVMRNVPMFVQYIGDRDTWTYRYDKKSNYFHEAFILAGSPNPESRWWDKFSQRMSKECMYMQDQLRLGKIAYNTTMALYKKYSTKWSYEVEFEGYKILVANTHIFTSEFFGDRFNRYPFVCVYCFDGSKYKYSLYSSKMDVLDIAKKHGGGGHPRACGFISDKLFF